MLAASKVRMIMSGSEKIKANRNTRTCVTRKSHVLIAQNNGKEMYKMFAARANLLLIFFANEIY